MKGGRNFLLCVTGIITVVGVIIQLRCVNERIADIEVLGQVYGAVGATIFGSLFFAGINFADKENTHSSIKYYITFSILIIIAAIASFYFINKNRFAIVLCVIFVGFLASGFYECSCQFDKKKRCNKYEVNFKDAKYIVEMEKIEQN